MEGGGVKGREGGGKKGGKGMIDGGRVRQAATGGAQTKSSKNHCVFRKTWSQVLVKT